MTKVWGYSDDNVVIDGAPYPNDEIDCYDMSVNIQFSDGAEIRIGYGTREEDGALWCIDLIKKGTQPYTITVCHDEEDDPYSDVYETEADYVSHQRYLMMHPS